MNISIQFLGAAGTVTGSKYLLTIGQRKIMVDCGLFQGQKELRQRNWQPLPVDAADIEAVIITHAHIDHIGYLPRLHRNGFRGRIVCTHATQELMQIMLLDSAKLQEEEAEYAARKGYSSHANPEPLYNAHDVRALLPLVQGFGFDEAIRVSDNVEILFRYSGHILGAASIGMTVRGDTQTKKIVFSGDLGRYNDPVLHDMAAFEGADALLVESTYGNRETSAENPDEKLTRIINETAQKNGCLVVPAFAVGRSQTMLYHCRNWNAPRKYRCSPYIWTARWPSRFRRCMPATCPTTNCRLTTRTTIFSFWKNCNTLKTSRIPSN